MNLTDVADRLGTRSGYDFINYGFVGLPVFRVTAEALCIDRTDLSAIEEFLLRAIQMNINCASELSQFLGLPKQVIEMQLADKIRHGQVRITGSDDSGERLTLTRVGQEVLRAQSVNRPRQLMVDFTFDGLLRTERYYPEASLQAPRDLKMISVPALRGVPDSGPDLEHLEPANINRTLELAAKTRKKPPVQVLKVLHVRRRTRLYLQALAFLFRSQTSGDLQVGFAIDGRLSNEHEEAFQRKKGTEKNRLFANLNIADPLDELKLDTESGLASKESIARIEALAKQSKVHRVSRPRKATKGTTLTLRIGSHAKGVEEPVRAVRRLPVLEHHDLLLEAITSAQNRLLIISPWIRREIVNESFLAKLVEALERGVTIYIGYGIGSRDEWQEIDRDCKRNLDRMNRTYGNFVFRRFGDTHAKILLKDSEFYVVSSFNWLSFRGDPAKPFREEWGNVISIPSEVDAFFLELLSRFEVD